MAEILIMPRLTDTMEEGVIANILVKEGDKVKSGDLLAEIETDKATMEWESFVEGEVLYIGVSEGDGVPVNDPVLILGKKGEDISDLKAKFGKSGASKNDSSESKIEEPKKEDSPKAATKEEPKKEKSATKKVDTSSINATVIRMRKMTDTMEEGVLASWLVKVGDKLQSGDIIAEVETDKATMDFDIYDEGEVLYLAVEEGDSVPIDAPIAVIGEKGADYKALLDSHSSTDNDIEELQREVENEEPKKDVVKQASMPYNRDEKPSGSSSNGSEGRIFISPLAKKMAEENGYDISQIAGTGENGRITKKDIENFTPQKAAPTKQATQTQSTATNGEQAQPTQKAAPVFAQEGTREEKVSQMRKAIAKSLSASKFTAPHFYLTIAVDMDKAIETRKMLNSLSDTKLSFNDIVIKSTALALKKHPAINASWQGETIRYNDNVHMGVAVAVDEGLLVPVVRFAEMKTLSQINKEVKDFATKAKDKKLQPSDWEGSTFTISNLGMFGIEEFTAIINAPNACILAVGAINEQPVVKNGEIVVGNIMKMTLSCDHRVVDGAVGAAFLQTLKEYMENPLKMLV